VYGQGKEATEGIRAALRQCGTCHVKEGQTDFMVSQRPGLQPRASECQILAKQKARTFRQLELPHSGKAAPEGSRLPSSTACIHQ
jgi:hypothetical protein